MTYDIIVSFAFGMLFGFSFYFLGKAHAYGDCSNRIRKMLRDLEDRKRKYKTGDSK